MFTRQEINKETLIPCHVLIKTVANLPVFSKEEDCLRFVFQIYAANLGKPGLNLHRKNIKKAAIDLLSGQEIATDLAKIEHEPLVNIISFVLVKNHAHFLLSANQKGGISKFINKLNLGFAKYYNLKNKREGVLFNKPFKMVPLQGNHQLNLVACYINIKSPLEISEELGGYKFSSFLDVFSNRKSKITADKSIVKYLGINPEKAEEYIEKINFSNPLFLE